VAARAEVALALVDNDAVGQRHLGRGAQRKIASFVRRVAGKAADLGRVGDDGLRIDLALPDPLDEAFVGVAALATFAIRVGRVAELAVSRSEVLRARAAHRILRLLGVARGAGVRQNAWPRLGLCLRKRLERKQEKADRNQAEKSPLVPHRASFLLAVTPPAA
jgi:hypothetical protein